MNSKKFNWIPALYILGYHLLLIVFLPIYFLHHSLGVGIIIASLVLMALSAMGVTAGYHRFYAHTTYKVHPIVEGIVLFFATMATQGSALRWGYDHREHHAFVDTDRDPYSIKKGFWYAHFLWLLEKPRKIESRVVADLLRNPLVRFQHRFYASSMIVANALPALLIGWWSGDFFGAFLFTWFARLFVVHHFSWFVNSLAHTWGSKTFCEELSAVDNYIVALLTFGEGYHNYHHAYALDYRNGIRWYHYDPTKWLIWSLHKLGLAKNLKKNARYFIEEKLLLDRKRLLIEKIQSCLDDQGEAFMAKIHELSESMLAKISQAKQLTSLYSQHKGKNNKYLQELRLQMKGVRKSLKQEYRSWMIFSRRVMALSQDEAIHQKIP